jgi:hypothetical protein
MEQQETTKPYFLRFKKKTFVLLNPAQMMLMYATIKKRESTWESCYCILTISEAKVEVECRVLLVPLDKALHWRLPWPRLCFDKTEQYF